MASKVAGRPKSAPKVEKAMTLRLTGSQYAALKDYAARNQRPLTNTIIHLATTNPDFVQQMRFAAPVEAS